MRLLVTRPQREAQAWVQALKEAGHEAHALPLIDIALLPSGVALDAAWKGLARRTAAMFVSANAVQGFFLGRAGRDLTIPAWATGPGTAKALIDAGVPASQIVWPGPHAPQFDSESLWALVASRLPEHPSVLIVRGADGNGQAATATPSETAGAGRDWLAEQIRGRGGEVHWLATYRRGLPVWTPEQTRRAQAAATDGSLWLLSSSESVRHLADMLPGQSWVQARALVTHERIADAARALGFVQVAVTRPAMADVLHHLASIESSQ